MARYLTSMRVPANIVGELVDAARRHVLSDGSGQTFDV